MAVLVVGHMNAGGLDVLSIKVMEHAFGDNYRTVVDAEDHSLDDGRDCELDDLVNRDRGLVEHLRDDGHRAVRGLADSEGEMTRAAAHGRDEEPVA